MTTSSLIAILLVAAGSAVMSFAVARGSKVGGFVPAELKRRWRAIIGLMLFFLAGYFGIIAVIMKWIACSIEVITGVVFLGGAVYVLIVMDLVRDTVVKMQSSGEALREREKLLRTVIDTEPECVKLVARNGTLITMNPAGLAMLQADSLDMVKGKVLYNAVDPEYRGAFIQLTRDVFNGGAGNLEFMITGVKGRKLWLETHAVPLRNDKDEIIALLGITRDITRRKLAEDALRGRTEELTQANKQLSKTVQDLTMAEEQLKKYSGELERSNRDLEQFAAVASHDLKSPVLAIAADLKLFEKRSRGRLDDESLALVKDALDSAMRLDELVSDLLAYARVGTDMRQYVKSINMAKLLDTVMAGLKEECMSAQCRITAGELPTITANPMMMAQLFQNLISNSIKFHGGDPPQIEISAEISGAEWIFSVRDNGIGIASEHHEMIFELFRQVPGGEARKGTGIGLAICKKIIERHGGRIWVESDPGKGAVFKFTLPA
ncbi:MAG: ATP-binding protein [Nitrospiraceae bacterium]|nr:ATP-binding protein [Nitrospiraceae bacterium]